MNYNTPQGLIDLAALMALSGDNRHYNEIRTTKNSMLVNENCLEWILREGDQERLISWLNLIKIETGLYNFAESFSVNEKNTKEFITSIDCKQISVIIKSQSIHLLENKWRALKSTDKIFTWFGKHDTQSKLATAYSWLCDNLEQLKPTPSQMASQLPQQNFQSITDLIIYFDKITSNTSEKILYIDRIKRRFNQAKYKEKVKNKKQCNYVLKIKTISMLEELAKINDKKMTEIIEDLINEEYNKTISSTPQ
ncbi:hypothetical protein [Aquitalea pelogenes]|uniref:hypothetical protein n=1 Tax=Aquitalea pelogenes TaxID=1293573 RepID=UPI0035B22A0F